MLSDVFDFSIAIAMKPKYSVSQIFAFAVLIFLVWYDINDSSIVTVNNTDHSGINITNVGTHDFADIDINACNVDRYS